MFASVSREEQPRNRSLQLFPDGAQTELFLCSLRVVYRQLHDGKAELPLKMVVEDKKQAKKAF